MSSDLHIHTTYSDGQMTPDEIIEAAKAAGLRYIALTDHDTVDALRYLYENEYNSVKGLFIIPGIELSAEYENHDVHILGYNIDIYSQPLTDRLAEIVEGRWARFSLMVEKLQDLGYDISEADVLKIAGTSHSVSRSHIARVLVKKGFFPNIRTVFDKVLDRGGPAYVDRYHISAPEAIDLVRQAGGLPVLAHPLLIGDDAIVTKLLKYDLAGIEVFYPQHGGDDTARYSSLADLHQLLMVGGSDFHALPGRYPEALGLFTIEDSYAEAIYKPR